MEHFGKRIKELIDDKNITVRQLADDFGIADTSIIYQWQNSRSGLLLDTAIKLANYFHCSIDYLVGIDDEFTSVEPKACPPFSSQLKKILAIKGVSQYKLLKDTKLSRGNLNNWFKLQRSPNINSVKSLANYFNISIDYLVGREN